MSSDQPHDPHIQAQTAVLREQPLGSLQQEFWLDQLLFGPSPGHNIVGYLDIPFALDTGTFTRALRTMVAECESLRSTVVVRDGVPLRRVHAPGPFFDAAVSRLDLAAAPAPMAAAKAFMDQRAKTAFDLAAGPLFDYVLISLAEDHHLWFRRYHHITADAWANMLMARRVETLYNAFTVGGEPPAWDQTPYEVFLAEETAGPKADKRERLEAFWRGRLQGVEGPLMRWPRQVGPEEAAKSGRASLNLPRAQADRADALAAAHKGTPFHVHLALLFSYLRLSQDATDIVVGIPLLGRRNAAMKKVAGLCTKVLPLRLRLAEDASFAGVLQAVSAELAAVYRHKDIDSIEAWAWASAGFPAGRKGYDASLTYMDMPMHLELSGHACRSVKLDHGHERTGLVLSVCEFGKDADVLLEIDANRGFFDTRECEALPGRLARLLDQALERPDSDLRDLDCLAPGEGERLRELSLGPAAPDFPLTPLPELFLAQARSRPEAPAVADPDGVLSYGELASRSAAMATGLLEAGLAPGALVGLLLPKGTWAVAATLGVLRAGMAYLPLDPDYPATRLAFMLEDARADAVVTCPGHADRLPAGTRALMAEDLAARPPVPESLPSPTPADRAYIIYTSGSTGRPKGVVCLHGGLANTARSLAALYGVRSESRVLQFASLSFDASVADMAMTLTTGACLHTAPQTFLMPGPDLAAFLREHRIDVAVLPPSVLAVTPSPAQGAAYPDLRRIISAGEACPPDLPGRWVPPGDRSGLQFLNAYGPTEATVCATVGAPFCATDGGPGGGAAPDLGRPIHNARVLICGRAGNPLPPGAAGELFLGGPGVAQGYHGRPELTVERFVSPARAGGERFYRSGDMGRLTPDGGIEYLGRSDGQLKVRGFRIEPGEVEAALRRAPGVEDAVVDAAPGPDGHLRLEAWVVTGQDRVRSGAPSGAAQLPALLPARLASELRTALSARLPAHMVPAVFWSLEAAPLTPSGKVDRTALARPSALPSGRPGTHPKAAEGSRQERPSDLTRELGLAASVWRELLGCGDIQPDDDFFTLGGHSLLAMRMLARLKEAAGAAPDIKGFFDDPTLRGLAQQLAAARTKDETLPPPRPRPSGRLEAPLSFAQARLWFLDRYEAGGHTYGMAGGLRLEGRLDAWALDRALCDLVERQDILRTVYRAGAEGEPIQRVLPAPESILEHEAMDGRGSSAVHRRLAELAREPFDLENGPVCRFKLLRLGQDRHLLAVNIHHIAADGGTLEILFQELALAYAARLHGRAPEWPPLAIRYGDFAAWQRQAMRGSWLETRAAYWKKALKDISGHLELPTDRPRPAEQEHQGGRVPFSLDAELSEALRRLARQRGASLFMVLEAGLAALLGGLAKTTDLVLGAPAANRSAPGTEALAGLFVNTVALRNDLSGDPSFEGLLERVKTTCLGAFAHQDLPFERLIDLLNLPREQSHSPVFQVMLSLQTQGLRPPDLEGLETAFVEADAGVSKFDLTVNVEDRGEDTPLTGGVEYDAALFDRATAELYAARYAALLRAAVARPETPLSRLPLMDPDEAGRVARFSQGEPAPTETRPWHALVAEQARLRPQAPAVHDDLGVVTYGELEARAAAMARRLASSLRQYAGAAEPPAESLVGLCLERSARAVAAMLAVLKAGAAFVPMDPAYPAERLAYIARDAGLACVLAEPATADAARTALEGLPAPVLLLGDPAYRGDRPETAAPLPEVATDRAAYVIYTSGSTGKPKGVVVEHRQFTAMLLAMADHFRLTPDDRMLQFASLNFDASLAEMAPTLARGACLHMADRERHMPGDGLAEFLRERRVSHMILTPTALAALGPPEAARLPELRFLGVGGEALPEELARQWCAVTRLGNGYGPTEAAITATTHLYLGGPMRIGRPLAGVTAHVLDADLVPLPIGVPGELCLGGAGVARGYLGLPERTAHSFVPDPFPGPLAAQDARLYRTGDLVRWDHEGDLEYLGRLDDQLKIRGHRVEPGEVEAALSRLPGVTEAAVVGREGPGGFKRLVAYLAPEPGGEVPDGATLRLALGRRLPPYMVPSLFVALPALPRTPSNKVDRRALPAPETAAALGEGEGAQGTARTESTAESEAERTLLEVWREVLAVERVAPEDNFFELGGDSILSVRMVARLRDAGLTVTVRDVFRHPSARALARAAGTLAAERPLAAKGPAVPEPAPEEGLEALHPLTPMQEGMVFHDLRGDAGQPYTVQLNMDLETSPGAAFGPEALQASWEALTRRHAMLRSAVVTRGDEPRLAVHAAVTPQVHAVDLRGEPEPQARLTALQEKDRLRGFELSRPPLARLTLVRLDERRYRLVVTFHHVIMDGWSMGLVINELLAPLARPDACSVHSPGAEPPPWSVYLDWLRERDQEQALEAWSRRLEGLEPTILDLGPPPAKDADPVSVHRVEERLSREDGRALDQAARSLRTTVNVLVRCAWALSLMRLTGARDVAFGAVVSGRPAQTPGIENLVGMCVNTLPVRARATPATTVADLARAMTRDLGLEDEGMHCPLGAILRRHGRRDAQQGVASDAEIRLFDSLLAFENFPVDTSLTREGGALRIAEAGGHESNSFPLNLSVVPGLRPAFRFQWDPARLSAQAVETAARTFLRLVRGLAHAPSDTLVDALPCLDEAETRRLTRDWSDGPAPVREAPLLHRQVLDHGRRHPGSPAVADAVQTLDHAALDERSGGLAARLHALGCGPDDPVGFLLERTVDLAVATVGILRAGAAFTPLDPETPDERLARMAASVGMRALVCHGPTRERCRALAAAASIPLVDLEETPDDTTGLSEAEPAPEDLAFVLFTSGTTGMPKAVAVEHAAIAGKVAAMPGVLNAAVQAHGGPPVLDAPTPVTASVAFDPFVEQLFLGLSHGGARIVGKQELLDRGRFLAELDQAGVRWINLAPSLAEVLLDQESGPMPDLACVALGGEALKPACLAVVKRRFPKAAVVNFYGPTEAVVDATAWTVPPASDPARTGPIPIGRPLPGHRAYVLDQDMRPVPQGVTGRLCLGGRLARGYLGREDLNAKAFPANPFRPGERLFDSGDLARWLPGGELEYRGRADKQIKIRGMRLEPGDVEAALLEHPAIAQAFVDLHGPAESGRLCAWAAPRPGADLPDADALRAHVQRLLPPHAVPVAFVQVPALPLTATGKVDRRALPSPHDEDDGTRDGFTPPAAHNERTLAAIWTRLLGVKRVGLDDNFFALGGDSILSMRLAAAARNQGLRLGVQDIFRHPLLRDMARTAGESTVSMAMDTAPPTPGPAPLTPIQRAFLEGPGPHDHYNQSVVLRTPAGTEPEHIARALGALLERHPALGHRFVKEKDAWVQVVPEAPPDNAVLETIDCRGMDDETLRTVLNERGQDLQQGMVPKEGRLLRALYCHRGPALSGRLAVAVHHLAVDAVSWRILIPELVAACEAAAQGREPEPEPERRSISFKAWAERLAAYAKDPAPRRELDYWIRALRDTPRLPPGLAYLDDPAPLRLRDMAVHRAELDRETTGQLLAGAPSVIKGAAEDILLTALWLALDGRPGKGGFQLLLEHHGRSHLFDDADLSHTVGWFTSLFPFALEAADADPLEAMKEIKERRRRVPGDGLGYGLLRHLAREPGLVDQAEPLVTFNYLGRFDELETRDTGGWGLSMERAGDETAPERPIRQPLDFGFMVRDGRLQANLSYPKPLLRESEAQALVDGFLDAVGRCVSACARLRDGGRRVFTPSDVPLAAMGQPALDALLRRCPDLQTVYPLTPLQEGLYFECVEYDGPPSGQPYRMEQVIDLEGPLDLGHLEAAWRALHERHESLRGLVHRNPQAGPSEAGQVFAVRAAAEPRFTLHDLSAAPDPEADAQALAARVRAEILDVHQAPMLRLQCLRLGPETHRLILHSHHLIFDGWSMRLALSQLFALYGDEALPPAPSLEAYHQWLGRMDKRQALDYWARRLEGLAPARALHEAFPPEDPAPGDKGMDVAVLPEALEQGLATLARRRRVTLAAVFQAAWGLLLSRLQGRDDVVFGLVVSGRSAEVPDIEQLLGMTINTLPLRVSPDPDAEAGALLEALHAGQLERGPYEAAPFHEILARVPAARMPSGQLFETLFNYQSRSMTSGGPPPRGQLRPHIRSLEEPGQYPLGLVIPPPDERGTSLILFRDATAAGRLGPRAGRCVMAMLMRILEFFASETDRPLRELGLAATSDRERLQRGEAREGLAVVDHLGRRLPPGVIGRLRRVPSEGHGEGDPAPAAARGYWDEEGGLHRLAPVEPWRPAWEGADGTETTDQERGGKPSGAAPPDTDLERTLADLWAEVLEAPKVKAEDSFLELGGHSLLAMRVAALVNKALEGAPGREDLRRCTAMAVLRAASLRDLARSLKAEDPEDPLIPLTPQQPTPGLQGRLYCCGQDGLSPYIFKQLAMALTGKLSVFSVVASATPPSSVDDMAGARAKAISQGHHGGPPVLLGWSLGGVVAYETARFLEAGGAPPRLLVLLDSYPFHDDAFPDKDIHYARETLREHDRAVDGLDDEALLLAWLRLSVEQGHLPTGTRPAEAREFLGRFCHAARLASRHALGPYGGPVLLVRAAQRLDKAPERGRDPASDLGWSRLVHGRLSVKRLPCDHYGLVAPDQAPALARLIIEALESSP